MILNISGFATGYKKLSSVCPEIANDSSKCEQQNNSWIETMNKSAENNISKTLVDCIKNLNIN